MSDAPSDSTERTARTERSQGKSRPGCVELDRFCSHCGYNLRTLPISRQPDTGIWVVRCTECGRYLAASELTPVYRPWLDFLTKFLVVGWMIIVLGLIINVIIVESALSYGLLDELTTHRRMDTLPADHPAVVWRKASGEPISQWTTVVVLRDEQRISPMIRTVMPTVAGLLSFALAALAVIVLPHWRRWAYTLLIILATVLSQGATLVIWWTEAPYLMSWAALFAAQHALVQLLGGGIGIAFGRPLARLSIRLLLPPSIRPRLAYLWLTDGRPPPAARSRANADTHPPGTTQSG